MLLSAGRHAILVARPMGWQQDGAHGAAHRSSDRSPASSWPSRQIGGPVRGYPAGSSVRWPARRVQSSIIAQADTLYSCALPAHRERAHQPCRHGRRTPIRRSTAWCCWAKAAECRLPCYAAPLVSASDDAGWLTRPEHGPVGLAGAGRASDARWVAQLWLLPDVLVRLAGDGGGAPARRWSAQALSTRQRGEGPRVG